MNITSVFSGLNLINHFLSIPSVLLDQYFEYVQLMPNYLKKSLEMRHLQRQWRIICKDNDLTK